MKCYMVLLLLSLIVSYLEMFKKAGRKIWEAVVPIYHLYVLFKILDLHIFLFIILFIFIVIPITSKFFLLLVIIYLPFIIADCFGYKMVYGFLGVLCPVIMLPYMVFKGSYRYSRIDNSKEDDLDQLVEESLRNCL